MKDFEKYRDYNCRAFQRSLSNNIGLNTLEFREYVICHNKADCDAGELENICYDEIKRLINEYGRLRNRISNNG